MIKVSKKDLISHLVSLIPKGKVITYGQVTSFLRIKSPRLVGQVLHKNHHPRLIPCHRVIFTDGSLSQNYAFGGAKSQRIKLEKEGIKFYHKEDQRSGKIKIKDFKKYLWQPTKVIKIYFLLLKQFGFPGPWPWFNQGKPATKEEIIIGAVLTQNTHWRNVEKALNNLRKEKLITIEKIYQQSKININKLKTLLKPVGFYNLKTKRLINLIKTIVEKYSQWENLEKEKIADLRNFLLSIDGIGKETADTIILYGLNKPIFVIDNYTKKFTKHFFNQVFKEYDQYQKFYQNQLPINVELFQNYHALIVQWGKLRL